MKLKLLMMFFLLSSFLAFSQKSATIKVTHFPGNTLVKGKSKFVAPNYIRLSTTNMNCFSFLDVAMYVKASGDKEKPYTFKVEVINKSSYEVFVNCSKWGFGSGGATTLRPGQTHSSTNNYSEKYQTVRIYDVDIHFNESVKSTYPFYYDYSENIDCNETPSFLINEMKKRGEKEVKIKELKKQIKSLDNSEHNLRVKISLYEELKRIDTKNSDKYNRKIQEIKEKLQKIEAEFTRKNEEIGRLKNQINSLGNTKEDLLKKKELYKKLASVDEEKNYDSKISEIEEEIKVKKKEETDKELTQNQEKNSANSGKSEDTNDAEKEEETEEEKERQRLIEKEQAAKEAQRKKEEAAERKRKQKEEAEKRRVARKQAYDKRVAAQNKRNVALASSAAASTAGILYMLGGFVYDNMGKPYPRSEQLYTGNGPIVGLDFGYTTGLIPYVFNSNLESYDGNRSTNKLESQAALGWTMNFKVQINLGYEYKYVGGYGFGAAELGISPIIASYAGLNYNYGARVFAGLDDVVPALQGFKFFAEYESGSRKHTGGLFNINSEETGDGYTHLQYQNIKFGIRYSWYKNSRTAYRQHFYLGIIEEKIKTDDTGFYVQNLNENHESFLWGKENNSNPSFNIPSKGFYRGYMLEWKQDHKSSLYVKFYPNYAYTGYRSGDEVETKGGPLDDTLKSGEGGYLIQIGFVRSLDSFGF